MATHQAYVLEAHDKPLSLQAIETPKPSSGQVLVRVLSAPIFSYSAGVLSGSVGFPLALPLTPGPSAIARVLSVSSDATLLNEGQLVFCVPIIRARDDVSGATSILHGLNGGASSQSMKLMEETWRNGSWAEKMITPLENVVPLDEEKLVQGLGYRIPQLTWINELLVAYGPLESSGFAPGDTVIVAPASGHFGGSVARLALALGAGTVVAAARGQEKLEALKGLCPADTKGRFKTVVLSGDVEVDTKALRQSTPGGQGADIYVDFSPFQATGATHPLACISALRGGGKAILCGGVNRDLSISYAQVMFTGISIKGNFMYSREAPKKLVGFLESGIVSLNGFDVKAFDFEKLQEGIEAAPKVESFESLAVVTPTK